MRDKKRINRILKLIKKIWINYPQLRLFQLLGNPFPPEDHYYEEDDWLEICLNQFYNIESKYDKRTKKT